MFEAGVPVAVLHTVSPKEDPRLCHKALSLMTLLLQNCQMELLDTFMGLLKEGNRYFNVFQFVHQRFIAQ